LVKSKVAVATSRPSGVFSCAVSDPAPGAGVVAGVVADGPGAPLWTAGVVPGWLLGCCGELHALATTTGTDSKRVATAVSLVMSAA
jgi:hypothetical protein